VFGNSSSNKHKSKHYEEGIVNCNEIFNDDRFTGPTFNFEKKVS
jgi:hypothetical protein